MGRAATKTVAIALRESLHDVDCDWLREQLVTQAGIHEVHFDPGQTHRLTIDYDPTALSETELLDRIYRQGVYPEPAP